MTQIGTLAFDPASPCQSTIVDLVGSTETQIFDALDSVLSDDAPANQGLDSWTDGYAINVQINVGTAMQAGALAQTCFHSTAMAGTAQGDMAALCVSGRVGEEDGSLAADGITARYIPRDQFVAESQAPSDENRINEMEDAGFTQDPQTEEEVPGRMGNGGAFSMKWFQPSESDFYPTIPRFAPNQVIQSYAAGTEPSEESWNVSVPCMTVALLGASHLMAGAAVAFGAASLF